MAYVAECRYSAPDDQRLKALTAMLRSEGKHVIERIGVLQWDLNGIAASLHLTQQETMDYFTDGRRVSFILERRICRDIIGGRLSPSEGAGFDLIDAHGRKWRGAFYHRREVSTSAQATWSDPDEALTKAVFSRS